MNPIERVVSLAMGHSKVIIVVMLLLTAAVGAGATQVEQDSSLEQFESDTEEAKASSFIAENFDANPNATTVQIIVRNESGNVLTRASLLRSLRYQQTIRDDDTVGPTLAENGSTVGVANIVARTAIVRNRSAQFEARAAALQERNQSLQGAQEELQEDFRQIEERNESLQRDRRELQARSDALNDTVENMTIGLVTLQELQKTYDELNESYEAGLVNDSQYAAAQARIEAEIASTKANVTAELATDNAGEFNASADRLLGLQNEYHQLNESLADGTISQETYDEEAARLQRAIDGTYQNGTQGVLAEEFQQLSEDGADLRDRAEQLQADAEALQERRGDLEERGQQLREDFEAFRADLAEFRRNPPDPTLEEQIETLESMNASAVRNVTTTVLSGDGGPGSDRALQLMATDYDPGSDTATARMVFVTQEQRGGDVNAPQAQDERITDAQLRMRDLAPGESGGEEYVVFGFGVINEEISQSQTDSMQIVGPLALLFVLITLLIAYRDLLDIVLGVFGIGLVLVWTWGFMGWVGISFNQIMIAVPVLLIGLSIDYAIHIFMRHREARTDDNGAETPRSSMRVAQAGVGVALIWVTATTVIGFMSNLISPLGPIQDFGVASSAGITATLLIFGLLIPALKVEIDGFFESRLGWDRTKRAFGTGGGGFSSVLALGSTAARKGPLAVILVAVLLTGAGAAGATQVDTSFQQSDFLAEEPPEVLYDLPEPFKPGQYSAKENLDYVYDNFQSPNQQAQVLINASDGDGSVATADTLRRLDAAEEDLRTRERYSDTVFIGAGGEANVLSPLTVMRDVAARNESFNESFRRADTDGDGVPDENVTALYDRLYETAPDQATQVIYRNADGEYTAIRMRVSVKGTATTGQVTTDMRALADERFQAEDAGLTAVATGDPIVNEIVQEQLLQTVIESLLITLVSVFVFLMIVYRITDGSASLGAVTLLPVALSVAWILGTMFLLDIPFNVVTGTITSLTIGLGVAYSIHLSERFNLEMDRQNDRVWPAMERSVTGTGGALLGSAATTAGGFGVLAFALLPALQQFGIITGITIVYAFLASVFVLPSLLAVWTRYLGPGDANFDADPGDDVFGDGDSPDDGGDPLADDADGGIATAATADDDPLGSPDDGADPLAGDATGSDGPTPDATPDADGAEAESGEAEAAAVEDAAPDEADTDAEGAAFERAYDEVSAADRDAADAEAFEEAFDEGRTDGPDSEAATEAAGAAGAGGAAAGGDSGASETDAVPAPVGSPDETATLGVEGERSVAPVDPAPGEELTVSVVARDVSGRVVLTESVPGVGGSVTSFDPSPLVRTRDGRTVFVVWDLDEQSDVGLTYTTSVPEDAAGGESLSFDGTVETAAGEAPVAGDVDVSVVTDFLAELRAADAVTGADLETAGRLARDGELTGDAFRAVYREWLRDAPDAAAAPETPPVGDGGTDEDAAGDVFDPDAEAGGED